MNPSDFLKHAEELANDGRPAWSRSAVSRAYYAVHHAAVDFLFHVGVRTTTGPDCHHAAINGLLGIDDVDQAIKEAGSDLMILHTKRKRADYDWGNASMERQDQAQDLVNSAQEILTTFEECLQDQDRADEIWSHFQSWIPQHGARLGLTLVGGEARD